MKELHRALPVKVLCFTLCILSLCVTVAGCFGIAFLVSEGFYTTTEERMLENVNYRSLLSDSFPIMRHALNEEERGEDGYYIYDYAYSSDESNIRFEITAPDGSILNTNIAGEGAEWEFTANFAVYTDRYGDKQLGYLGKETAEGAEVYTFKAYLEPGLPVNDGYALKDAVIRLAYALRYWVYTICTVSLLLFVTCFIMLMCTAGRRRGSQELYPGAFYRVPFDLLLAGCVVFFEICIMLIIDVFYSGEALMTALLIALAVCGACAVLGLCISFAVRIKGHTLLKNTVIYRACILTGKVLKWSGRVLKKAGKDIVTTSRKVPLIWRTLLIVGGVVFFDMILLIAAMDGIDLAAPLWVLKNLAFAVIAFYSALFMRELQKGGRALAKGDLAHRVDTRLMFWDFKGHGEDLNSISDGMAAAVEQRLQSERMKTELITNVSHDIKTPLTSIINYSSLIAEEPCDCERHAEYTGVLLRKSEHLKRLLDDLVEASKASTGNLEVNLASCDAGVLLTQAAGEFAERCTAAGLELITARPEGTAVIMADSRRIWRVFENLMSNACKYSLGGSRVYLCLEREGNDALFVFKNTSLTPLNISPAELMERFVRGDAARSTEGNGLGLSIARSLTELQGGSMDITIDGDLFKVTLRFPVI